MKKLLGFLRARTEAAVAVAVILVTVIGTLSRDKEDLTTAINGVAGEVAKEVELRQASDKAAGELLDAKIKPIAEGIEKLDNELEVLEGTVGGLEIAATHGADQRALRLEGRLIVVQQQLVGLRFGVDALADSFDSKIEELERELEPDTVQAPPDTVIVEVKGRGFLRRAIAKIPGID